MQSSHFQLLFFEILPESVSILLVNGNYLFDHLWQLKPKLIGPFRVMSTTLFHHGNCSVSFLLDIGNPPVKDRLLIYALGYGIFGNLHWSNSLILDNFSHNVDSFCHLQHVTQPAVDFLRVSGPLTTTFWSSTLRADPWLMNIYNKRYSFLSTSHWSYIDSEMMLAANSVISPHKIPLHTDVYPKWGSDWIY